MGLPVVLLTGSLGAGKTTALNRALQTSGGRRIAILENEAGRIDVDGALLVDAGQSVRSLVGGCACCTLVPQLTELLAEFATARDDVDVLILEASGLADPHALLGPFQADGVRGLLHIEQVVTVVDVEREPGQAPDPWLWDRQVSLADTIVLARDGERLPTPAAERVRERLELLNPQARRIAMSSVDADVLLQRPRGLPAADAQFGALPEPSPATGFRSLVVEHDAPLQRTALVDFLELLALAGAIVRAKGLVALAGSQHRHLVELAGGRVTVRRMPGLAPASSRVVLIGRGLDSGAASDGFAACATSGPAVRG